MRRGSYAWVSAVAVSSVITAGSRPTIPSARAGEVPTFNNAPSHWCASMQACSTTPILAFISYAGEVKIFEDFKDQTSRALVRNQHILHCTTGTMFRIYVVQGTCHICHIDSTGPSVINSFQLQGHLQRHSHPIVICVVAIANVDSAGK